MDERLIKVRDSKIIKERYDLVISYMEDRGIVFKPAMPDHMKNHYRIRQNDSSIFVYLKDFKMNLCEIDKQKLESLTELNIVPLIYTEKGQKVRDNVRPWTCRIPNVEVLEKVIDKIGLVPKTYSINDPRPYKSITDDKYECPNCSYLFDKSERCPECGQLIDYSSKS